MKEAARQLGKGYNTIWRWIKRGKIKCHKFGRDWVIEQEEIDRIKREGVDFGK